MKIWHLAYGQTNYTVHITEVPLWRVVVEESYMKLLDLMGCPCCWSLKWLPSERLRDWVSVGQFKLLNNRLAHAASGRHEKHVEKFSITETHARLIDPAFVDDVVDIFSDDDE